MPRAHATHLQNTFASISFYHRSFRNRSVHKSDRSVNKTATEMVFNAENERTEREVNDDRQHEQNKQKGIANMKSRRVQKLNT